MKLTVSLFAPLAVAFFIGGCTSGSINPKADSNQDGGVSFSEFDAYMKETIFTAFDENGDSFVSMKEWRALNPTGPNTKFRNADPKGDGRVSRAESDAKLDRDNTMKPLFQKIDTDGNGRLSEEEIAAFEAQMKAQSGPTDLDKLKQATQ
jgi:Ca2+-binding EF-hand superfamily protein